MMRRTILIAFVMLLTACAPQPMQMEKDGGIGGTDAAAE